MEMWSTIATAVAVAGMGWNLALRFQADRRPSNDQQGVTALQLVSRKEPAA